MSDTIIEFFKSLPESRFSEEFNDVQAVHLIEWLYYQTRTLFLHYTSLEQDSFWELAFNFRAFHAKLEGNNELNIVYTPETFITTEQRIGNYYYKAMLWSNGAITLSEEEGVEIVGHLYVDAKTAKIFGYPIPE